MLRVGLGVLAAVVVITAAWWFAFYSPANEQQTALEAETASLVAQQGQLQTQLAQLMDIRAREVEIRADITRLEQFIPTNPGQASLIRQVQQAADASGVTIITVAFAEPMIVDGAPAPSQPGLALGSLTATGSIQGGYFQIVDFFRRLEVEVARAILLKQVMLEEGEQGFPSLTANFTADVFALITLPFDPNAVAPTPEPTDGETPAEGADDTEGTEGATEGTVDPEGEGVSALDGLRREVMVG